MCFITLSCWDRVWPDVWCVFWQFQYRLVYECIAMYLQCGITVVSAVKFPGVASRLAVKDPRTRMLGFEKEFQVQVLKLFPSFCDCLYKPSMVMFHCVSYWCLCNTRCWRGCSILLRFSGIFLHLQSISSLFYKLSSRVVCRLLMVFFLWSEIRDIWHCCIPGDCSKVMTWFYFIEIMWKRNSKKMNSVEISNWWNWHIFF